MTTSKKLEPIIFYHKNCADGFMAAAIFKSFPDYEKARTWPIQYGDMTDDTIESYLDGIKKRDVVIVDFSFSPEHLKRVCGVARSILWLDHHKTTFDNYGLNIRKHYKNAKDLPIYKELPVPSDLKVSLSMKKSGAVLAWESLYGNKSPLPMAVEYVQDYDLWTFYHGTNTHYFNMGLNATRPWDDAEIRLMALRLLSTIYKNQTESTGQSSYVDWVESINRTGKTLYVQHMKDVEYLSQSAVPCEINQKLGYAVNAPAKFRNEIGHKLAEIDNTYGLVWWADGRKIRCSLRSVGKMDVEKLARLFGGGGHMNASAFETNMTLLETFLMA